MSHKIKHINESKWDTALSIFYSNVEFKIKDVVCCTIDSSIRNVINEPLEFRVWFDQIGYLKNVLRVINGV